MATNYSTATAVEPRALTALLISVRPRDDESAAMIENEWRNRGGEILNYCLIDKPAEVWRIFNHSHLSETIGSTFVARRAGR